MSLSQEIIEEFNRSFKKARVSGEPEPTAMVLATSDGKGYVTSRTVLLKALDENGFVFLIFYPRQGQPDWRLGIAAVRAAGQPRIPDKQG